MLSIERWCCFEFGVYALSVVVVDLQEEGFHEQGYGFKAGNIAEIFLELAVEGFLVSVLPGRSFGTEGCLDVMLFEQGEIGGGGVFAALVRMQILRSRMREQSMAQGIEDERLIMRAGERKADDFSAEEIEDGTQVPELPMEPEVREIRSPENVPP